MAINDPTLHPRASELAEDLGGLVSVINEPTGSNVRSSLRGVCSTLIAHLSSMHDELRDLRREIETKGGVHWHLTSDHEAVVYQDRTHIRTCSERPSDVAEPEADCDQIFELPVYLPAFVRVLEVASFLRKPAIFDGRARSPLAEATLVSPEAGCLPVVGRARLMVRLAGTRDLRPLNAAEFEVGKGELFARVTMIPGTPPPVGAVLSTTLSGRFGTPARATLMDLELCSSGPGVQGGRRVPDSESTPFLTAHDHETAPKIDPVVRQDPETGSLTFQPVEGSAAGAPATTRLVLKGRLGELLNLDRDNHRITVQASISQGKFLARLEIGPHGHGSCLHTGKGDTPLDAIEEACSSFFAAQSEGGEA